jgi:UDP-N-acetylmuramate dehydrogenase
LAYWYQDEDNIKISAGWLVENAGFKDFHSQETGMATWPAQAMVLVNEHARTTADLLVFRKLITDTVKKKFDIQLEQEPELLP